MCIDKVDRQKPWEGLFERLVSEWGQRQSPEWDSAESPLPSSVYTDPDQYQAEVTMLFHGLPLCLGHVDQLEAEGTIVVREIAGMPLLITRDPMGDVRVFVNACRHRGARLVDQGVCHRSSISCLYHGWTYGLDGRLLSVPRSEGFPNLDVATHGLRQLPSAVRHGMIWVVLNRRAPPPDIAMHLGQLDADLASIGLARHHFFRQNAVLRSANWKLIVDAFIEYYHIKRLHAATVGQYFADCKAVGDFVGPHMRILVARDEFPEATRVPRDQWDPQRHGTLVHFIFPNSLLIYHPDYISHIGVFPVGIARSLFVHSVLTPDVPSSEKAQAHWDRSFDLIDGRVFNDEDLFICEQIQSGLAGLEEEEFLLGRFENNVHRFHQTVSAALRGAVGCER